MENEKQPTPEVSNDPKPSNNVDQIMESLAQLQKKFTDFEAFLNTQQQNKVIEQDKNVIVLPAQERQKNENEDDESWKDYNF